MRCQTNVSVNGHRCGRVGGLGRVVSNNHIDPVLLVPPTVWKKRVLLGFTHDKAGALQFCASRWPTTDLVLPGCRKPHDGIADALCLADYGRSTL